MDTPKELTPRFYTQEYLSNYAALFAHLAEGEEEHAHLAMAKLKVIERQAESLLDQEGQKRFLMQRQRLCRLFKTRLISELQDQLEQGVIEKAEKLISDCSQDQPH